MEIRQAAIIAKELNRTLVLPPIVHGKTGDTGSMLEVVFADAIYDISTLCGFVPVIVASGEIDPEADNSTRLNCKSRDVRDSARLANQSKNVEMVFLDNCLLPTRPLSSEFDLWKYLRPPTNVVNTAKLLSSILLEGEQNKSFASFHWRFEEGKCGRGRRVSSFIGLCFRLPWGGIIDVTEDELAAVVLSAAQGLPIFLATDGRNRGKTALVDSVKQKIAVENQILEIGDLLSNKNTLSWTPSFQTQVEQAVCHFSRVHIGSSRSSWDWEVFFSRGATQQQEWFQIGAFLNGIMSGTLNDTILRENSLRFSNMQDSWSVFVDAHLNQLRKYSESRFDGNSSKTAMKLKKNITKVEAPMATPSLTSVWIVLTILLVFSRLIRRDR